ncbi:hypothetical protein T10_2008, partial [Trichinella papuae]
LLLSNKASTVFSTLEDNSAIDCTFLFHRLKFTFLLFSDVSAIVSARSVFIVLSSCNFLIVRTIFYSSAPPNSLVCWSEDSPCHKKIKPRSEKLVVRFNSPPPGVPRKGLSPIIIPRRFLVRQRPRTNDDKNENNTADNSNASSSCSSSINSSSDSEKKTSTTSTPQPPQPQTPVRRPAPRPSDDNAVEMLALMLKERLAQAKRRRQLFPDDDEQTTSTNTVAVSDSLQSELDAFLAHSEIDDLFATVDLSNLEFNYSQPSSSNLLTPYERYKASVTTDDNDDGKSQKRKHEAEAENVMPPKFIAFDDDDDEFFETAEVLEILRQY